MKVEIFLQNEKNSRYRDKYDEQTLEFIRTDELLAAAEYQYGFIPGTTGEDGDCIDVWSISESSHDTGKPISAEIIGALEMYEEYRGEKQSDIKIFVSPEKNTAELTEDIVAGIKDFTRRIFKKFPEVSISFGKTLTAEEAELRLKE